jgi:hypothetical protein
MIDTDKSIHRFIVPQYFLHKRRSLSTLLGVNLSKDFERELLEVK